MDAWDRVLEDDRVRKPLDQEDVEHVQPGKDWDKPIEPEEAPK